MTEAESPLGRKVEAQTSDLRSFRAIVADGLTPLTATLAQRRPLHHRHGDVDGRLPRGAFEDAAASSREQPLTDGCLCVQARQHERAAGARRRAGPGLHAGAGALQGGGRTRQASLPHKHPHTHTPSAARHGFQPQESRPFCTSVLVLF